MLLLMLYLTRRNVHCEKALNCWQCDFIFFLSSFFASVKKDCGKNILAKVVFKKTLLFDYRVIFLNDKKNDEEETCTTRKWKIEKWKIEII